MALHFVRIGGITMLLVLCMFYPFLPGEYDGLALALSTIAQLFGTIGLLLVPVGAVWLVYEGRKRARRNQKITNTVTEYYLALASVIVASFVAIVVSLSMLLTIGISLCVLALAVWLYAVFRLTPKLRLLKDTGTETINPAPFYLVCIPIALLLFQVLLASRVTEFSRNHAINESAEVIKEIEKHQVAYGRYPSSLQGVHADFKPSVVGVEKFHYAASGNAYNLYFEQPKFLLDNLGTREFVVYNKLNEHVMPSHAAWTLQRTQEQLRGREGWYAVHDASIPHWKYFWFD